jgi:hypothetical protein
MAGCVFSSLWSKTVGTLMPDANAPNVTELHDSMDTARLMRMADAEIVFSEARCRCS